MHKQDKKYNLFCKEIITLIGSNKVFDSLIDRISYGAEASFYHLTPKLVLKPKSEEDVINIIKTAKKHNLPYTFKAAGTSLSGQSITNSILIVAREGFEKVELSDDKEQVTLGVGVIAGNANAFLAPFGKKIGPDPATVNHAMIGGIVNNNSSGMCCGIDNNTYKTVKHLRFILQDGTLVDTACKDSVNTFRKSHKSMLEELENLAKEVSEDKELSERIKHKYKIKNTTGYSINALVDYKDGLDILVHLIIGSEGTLAFVSQITYSTVVEQTIKATSLVLFKNTENACDAIAELKKANDSYKIKDDELVSAIEFMDRQSLASVEDKEELKDLVLGLGEDASAILIDVRAFTDGDLDTKIAKITNILQKQSPLKEPYFTKNNDEFNRLWAIRKGLLPSVGNVRKQGTSVIIEDVAFPDGSLKSGTIELQKLLKKYNYHKETLIFGHALDSNLHFVFAQDFQDESEIKRYDDFIKELVELVAVKYDGSLKAEHGTGRNMAPFVEREWGAKAYSIMKSIKKIVDPSALINPDVLINEDKKAHLDNLKVITPTSSIIDRCMECGFCESVCPSRDLTLTPRGRIIIARELARLKKEGKTTEYKELLQKYQYNGIETCVTCGLCQKSCPVLVDTGKFIKEIKNTQHGAVANSLAGLATKSFPLLSTLLENSLGTYKALNNNSVKKSLKQENPRDFFKNKKTLLPQVDSYFPSKNNPSFSSFAKNKQKNANENAESIVYVTTCINRFFGKSKDHFKDTNPVFESAYNVLLGLGYNVIIPKDIKGLCCGLSFSSQGFENKASSKSQEFLNSLTKASNNGKYKVVLDNSSCSENIKKQLQKTLDVYDSVDFINDVILKNAKVKNKKDKIALHITCSSKKMNHENKVINIANTCADSVVVPIGIGCCGAAGDKFINSPSIGTNALRTLKEQVQGCQAGYSSNSSCEANLSRNSSIKYYSLWRLLEETLL